MKFYFPVGAKRASQVALVVKNLPANAGDVRDTGLIPGSGRISGGYGNPLQYSCLKNSMESLCLVQSQPLLLLFGCSVGLFVTPWTAAHQASLPFTISWSLLEPMSIESMISSNHLILCHPFSCLQSFPLAGAQPYHSLTIWASYQTSPFLSFFI